MFVAAIRLPIDLEPSSNLSSHSHAPFSQATPSNCCRPHWQHTTITTIPTQTHSIPRHVYGRTNTHSPPKTALVEYHLNVGAYSFSKCTLPTSTLHYRLYTLPFPSSPADDLNLAVQVGEDAYFIRDKAMGIADGIGGCS